MPQSWQTTPRGLHACGSTERLPHKKERQRYGLVIGVIGRPCRPQTESPAQGVSHVHPARCAPPGPDVLPREEGKSQSPWLRRLANRIRVLLSRHISFGGGQASRVLSC